MKTKIKPHVIKTCKISKLYRLDFNRIVEMAQVKVLVDAVHADGLIRLPVIVVTDIIDGRLRAYLIDGQHLVAALEIIGETHVDCIVLEKSNKEEMALSIARMNTTSKSWKLEDFVHAFASIGNEHYEFLLSRHKSTGLTVRSLGEVYSSNIQIVGNIKKGKFVVDRREQGDKILKLYKDLGKFIGYNSHQVIGFVKFYRGLQHKPYNHALMISALVSSNMDIKGLTTTKTTEVLNSLYLSEIERQELKSLV